MNKVKRSLLTLSVCFMALSHAGCGYKMGSVKPSAYEHIRKIAVPTFVNETLEPRVSVLMTNAVIKQMQMDGTYQVATLGNADAELRGTIFRIERQQLRSARANTFRTTEMASFMIIKWALHDPVTGKKLKYSQGKSIDESLRDSDSLRGNKPGEIEGRTIFYLDPNFQTSERNAIPLAAQRAAEQLVSQIAEGW